MVYWNCFGVGSQFRLANPSCASHRQCHSSFTVLQSFCIYRDFDVKIFKISRTIGTVQQMLTKNVFLKDYFVISTIYPWYYKHSTIIWSYWSFFPLFSWKTFVEKNCTWQSVCITCFTMSHDRDFTFFTEHYRNSNPSSLWKIPDIEDSWKLLRKFCIFCIITRLNGYLYQCIHFPTCFNMLYVPVHPWRWFTKTGTW